MDILHHIFTRVESMQLLSSNLVRLLLAAGLGGAIGLERELSHKPAGLRTNMFICFGSAMFTILSELMVDPQIGDHTRIAANIITGIGFIGAGSMLLAIFATVCILVALRLLGILETRFNLKPLHMAYEAAGAKADQMVAEINGILEADHRLMESVQVAPADGGFLVRFTMSGTYREHQSLLEALKKAPIFSRITFI